MTSDDLINLIECELISHIWNNGENNYWEEVLEDEINYLKISNQQIDINKAALISHPLILLARKTLASISSSELEDFETVSDCLHAKSSVHTFPAPELASVLIEVLIICLEILDALSEKSSDQPATIHDLLCKLLRHTKEANYLADQRAIYENSLAGPINIERLRLAQKAKTNQNKMDHARNHRQKKYDWEKVLATEKEYFNSGRPTRDWANLIKNRFGIPTSTYRDWRKKNSPYFKKTTV